MCYVIFFVCLYFALVVYGVIIRMRSCVCLWVFVFVWFSGFPSCCFVNPNRGPRLVGLGMNLPQKIHTHESALKRLTGPSTHESALHESHGGACPKTWFPGPFFRLPPIRASPQFRLLMVSYRPVSFSHPGCGSRERCWFFSYMWQ